MRGLAGSRNGRESREILRHMLRGLGAGILVGVAWRVWRAGQSYGARVRDMLEAAGAGSVTEITPDSFVRIRRAASKHIARPGLLTLTVPPSATAHLLAGFRDLAPLSPVIAHPLSGRIHILTEGGDTSDVIGKRVLAAGGKRLSLWGWTVREGLASAFSPQELAIARSLKRSLDPAGVLNPHFHLG